jgi:hypothetical protein
VLTAIHYSTVGGNPDLFSVNIEHNGFFCGLRDNLDYVSGTIDHYDNCNVDTWSLLWIHEFLTELGHKLTERLHIYWLLPGKDLTDGLVCIEKDEDIVEMIKATTHHKVLCLMIDHTNFLKNLRGDVIINIGPPLPPVNEPEEEGMQPHGEDAEGGMQSDGEAVVQEGEEEGMQSHGEAVVQEDEEETDSEFVDSDWDAEDGDDDIFQSQVDRDVNDHNDPLDVNDLEDEAAIGDEDLQLTKEQEDYLKYRFSEFNPEVDMENPEFKVGMVFANATELRNALAAYSIRNRVKVKKTRNEAGRINAECEPGCTWMLKASSDSRKEALTVRVYTGKRV